MRDEEQGFFRTEYGSVWVAAQVPLFLLAFGLPHALPATVLPWPSAAHPWRECLGAALGPLGLLLLAPGLARLGRNLTPLPRPRAGASLVTSGIYGLVRHPIYGGVVLLALGSALRAASWVPLPVSLLVLLFFDRKAGLEERWLAERFDGYAAYRHRTAKLFPWIY